MSEANSDLFERYVGHVRHAIAADARTEQSQKDYHGGKALQVQRALQLATRRFERIAEDYQQLTGLRLESDTSALAVGAEHAESAELALESAGRELKHVERVIEALRAALPLWMQVDALDHLACGNREFVAWRSSVRVALEHARSHLVSDDPTLIDKVTIAMKTAISHYESMRAQLEGEFATIKGTLSRSGSLIRSSERSVDAAFRRRRTGGGRALKNAMSFGIVAGVLGYVVTFLYALTDSSMKGADVAKLGATAAGVGGFVVGGFVGWYRFMRPAVLQLRKAENKLVSAEKAVEKEEARFASLKSDLKLLPVQAAVSPEISLSAPSVTTVSAEQGRQQLSSALAEALLD